MKLEECLTFRLWTWLTALNPVSDQKYEKKTREMRLFVLLSVNFIRIFQCLRVSPETMGPPNESLSLVDDAVSTVRSKIFGDIRKFSFYILRHCNCNRHWSTCRESCEQSISSTLCSLFSETPTAEACHVCKSFLFSHFFEEAEVFQ